MGFGADWYAWAVVNCGTIFNDHPLGLRTKPGLKTKMKGDSQFEWIRQNVLTSGAITVTSLQYKHLLFPPFFFF